MLCRTDIGQRIDDFHLIQTAQREEVARSNKLRRMSRKQRESALGSGVSMGAISRQSSESRRPSACGQEGSAHGAEGDEGALSGGGRGGASSDMEEEGVGVNGGEPLGPHGDSGDDGSDMDVGTPAVSGDEGWGEGESEDTEGHTVGAWWQFAQKARCGLRRWLGEDALGRRLWLLAGRAGAFQVR
jgi:hypothetical protein